MEKKEREALVNFMINILDLTYPAHQTCPFKELKDIEEAEGEESDGFNEYSEYIQQVYWMKRDIEIIAKCNIY